ncbi:related to nitrogen metabolic regulation protein nmr [Rhynchosporium graminicola]|uniref:Related to nitrogen metabolic regulation protein nmr n=1 Tax=Rhynchosporium graminicola TaxID=2792576 RepID=A0A1E1LDX9_9HELO|nr:related to nitrogen metabolic regulation protein nmr [Rhynchosporium commune]
MAMGSTTPTPRKLIVVIGVTGNQGGSVASRFLSDPTYRIRGLTRNPASPAAVALARKGIEIVAADLEDVESLKKAFEGANLIFSVTNYWEPFWRPDARAAAEKKGITCRKWAYEVELRQGKNIADAAGSKGVVEGLDEMGFVASTLSNAKVCSKGKYQELYHFDSKAEVFPGYVEEKYPELAKKMSCVQTGYFMSSYKLAPGAYFAKQPDNSYIQYFPTSPTASVPHIAINSDLGPFIHGVIRMGPGKHYMAAGTECSWAEFVATWSRVTGKPARYQMCGVEDMAANCPDRMFGEELADMFDYSSDPGYDGGDKTLLKAEDIRKAGFECPMTSLEEYFKNENWDIVFNQ